MFEGFKSVLNLSNLTNFSQIFSDLENFIKKDHNILVRAYLCINLFHSPSQYFGKVDIIDLIYNDWKNLGYNKAKSKRHQLINETEKDFDHFVERTEQVINAILLACV